MMYNDTPVQLCRICGKYTTNWVWVKDSSGFYHADCPDCLQEEKEKEEGDYNDE